MIEPLIYDPSPWAQGAVQGMTRHESKKGIRFGTKHYKLYEYRNQDGVHVYSEAVQVLDAELQLAVLALWRYDIDDWAPKSMHSPAAVDQYRAERRQMLQEQVSTASATK